MMKFTQNIHKTSYDLGSKFENWCFIHMMICDPIVFEKSSERTILNV